MKDLSVSIVIVTFRSARLTVDCLRAVEKERSRPGVCIRTIVVDNASGDFPLLERAVDANGWSAWVTLRLAPRNGGFAYGNNLGIRLALETHASDYILLLNPDTLVRPGAVETLVRFLEMHPQAGIAGGSFENPDGSEWPIAFRFPTMVSEVCSALDIGGVTRIFRQRVVARHMQAVAQPVDWICGASMMIRAEVFRAIGGMDENYFLYFEETDFCLRAQRSGFATWYVPESRVMHIGGQSTGVDEWNSHPKRRPAYWFESRRRYFAVAYGIHHAMLIDFLVLLAYPIGWLKRLALRRSPGSVPHFWRDFLRGSILWPQNRRLSSIRETVSALACGPRRA